MNISRRGLTVAVCIFVSAVVLIVTTRIPAGPPAPIATENGDSNGDGIVDVADAVHLLFFLFQAGPAPAVLADSPELVSRVVALESAVSQLIDGLDQKTQEIQRITGEVETLSGIVGDDLCETVRNCPEPTPETVGINLVEIPAGSFRMGSSDGIQFQVNLSNSFHMSDTEVTQAQYQTVMGTNPSQFFGCSDCPVENVNWYEAIEFCRKLTARERVAGTIDPDEEFRLPTEAEWEYTCRAGTTTRFSFGDAKECNENCGLPPCPPLDANMWYCPNNTEEFGPYGTKRVSQKPANPWGLHDMHGNVWEWCLDFLQYSPEEKTDPVGTVHGRCSVIRGGDIRSFPYMCRSAYRRTQPHESRGNITMIVDGREFQAHIGFRVVLVTEP